MRRWLPAFAYDHPVTVLMGCLALIVLGSIAWMRIPIQLLPDGIETGQLVVRIQNPGSAPRETDDQVVRPVTAQLSTIPGVKQLRTTADAQSASFNLEFYPSVPSDEAYNLVVDRMERAMADLPSDIDRYFIFKFNPADLPVLFAGVTLPETVDDPYHLLTRIVQPRLERVPGVAAVDVRGVPQRSVYIEFDREKILAHGVDVGSVQRGLQADNFQMAAGRIEDRGQVRFVRSIATLDQVDQLRRWPVQEGIVLSDIATVELRGTLSSDIGRLNGEQAAIVLVRREAGANMVEVTRRIEREIESLNEDPRLEGAQLMAFFSQGDLVVEAMDNLLWTALVGGVLAVIVLFAFLREWRMTLLIALSIPFSLLITIAVLYFRGDSLNLLALMGLMLAVGMVVDNAIVVVETIYRRRADGEGAREAAIGGVSEVNLAIIMSTATTMVVFLPLILMSGEGSFTVFLGALGYPVIFALGASLLVALVVAPLVTRAFGQGRARQEGPILRRVAAAYTWVLDRALRRRFETVIVLVALGLLTLIPLRNVPMTVVDEDAQNQFDLRVEVAPQIDPNERSQVLGEVEALLADRKSDWGISAFYTNLDGSSTRGRITVFLQNEGPMSRTEVMAAAREALPEDRADARWSVGFDQAGRGSSRVDFTITGEDMDTLLLLAEEAARRVGSRPGVMNASVDTVESGVDELRMVLDRQALVRYGLTGQSVAGTISFYLRGTGLQPLRMGDREVEVINRFELEDRSDLAAVLDSPVFSSEVGGLVPLRALTHVEGGKGPGSIQRIDNRTAVRIGVDLEDGIAPYMAGGLVREAMSGMAFPRGYTWEQGQSFSVQAEDMQQQIFVIGMSVVFVFLLMGILFESWLLPLSILITLPMAGLGAWWMLWLTSTPFDTMAGIGLVILVGVVVNNGIVLIDLVAQLRAGGLDRHAALVEAGRRRLRPILMTALTTIFGLVPMAVGGSDFVGVPYAPLGRTVIGGLGAATLLTLIFVPFLYAALDDLRTWAGQAIGAARLPPPGERT
ncbi:MAG: efflux RND transporter permease subunit [Deltaproteobacteria bacterium]|nr:MAG: efflux RND transporter permease subunit [Deltaproteobacteria bacterium]